MKPSTKNQRLRINELLAGLGWKSQKYKLIMERYQATSLHELFYDEAKEFTRYLSDECYERGKKMRGTIIHYLALLGYTTEKQEPDYDRINKFVLGLGSRNPRKKKLNGLYPTELNKIVTQIKAMYSKEIKRR